VRRDESVNGVVTSVGVRID